MEIRLLVADQYGKSVFYPNCERAKIFSNIANTKTITVPTIKQIRALGYEIKYDYPTHEGQLP